jgi:glycosyltransferase involved in cell wall biosynthesis
MHKKLSIAYYCSNRTIFPPPKNLLAANATVMQDIAEEVINRGHKVTIYASKGSGLKGAKIIDLGLRAHETDIAYDRLCWVTDLNDAYRISYISQLAADSKNYDIIHLHVGRTIFGEPFVKFCQCPVLFTIHEDFNPAFEPLMKLFPEANLVSISDSQRKKIPGLNYVATIYHGVDLKKFPFEKKPKDDHFVFLSRLVKDKGIEIALEVAKKTNITLNLYGPCEEEYFKNSISPFLNNKISYKGLAKKYSKEWTKAYAQAKALLFPIQWEEPFGLVMIEAMACGTPVIAFARGAVPEVLEDGKTGFIINASESDTRGNWVIKKTGMEGILEAIERIKQMSQKEYSEMRKNCRELVKKRFTIEKMVDEYEKLYEKLLNK